MQIKIKFIRSSCDKETGYSVVVLQYKGKVYLGEAVFNSEEDPSEWSNFAGCKYAEMRAYRKIYKERLKELRIERKSVQNMYNILCECKDCDEDTSSKTRVRKYIAKLEEEMYELSRLIDSLSEERIKRMDTTRHNIFVKLNAKKSKND